MISKTSTYAIRAVLLLSITPGNKKLSPKNIAEKIGVPAPFLAKTLQVLSKNGIVSSVKGRNGGFYMTDENSSKTLLDILDALGELEKLNRCFIGLPKCNDNAPCPIHFTVKSARGKMLKEMSRLTIGDFSEEIKDGKSFISL